MITCLEHFEWLSVLTNIQSVGIKQTRDKLLFANLYLSIPVQLPEPPESSAVHDINEDSMKIEECVTRTYSFCTVQANSTDFALAQTSSLDECEKIAFPKSRTKSAGAAL